MMSLERPLDARQPVPSTPDEGPADQVPAAESPKPAAAVDAVYWLVSLESARAPAGCAGTDWFVYRIAQGDNAITGYRQGTRSKVSADVATIVTALNDRRQWSKSKPSSNPKQRRAAPRTDSTE